MNDAQIPADDGLQVEDIKALRGEGRGELRALLRAQIDIGRARREPPKAKPVLKPPGHKPGAWPPGCSPPGPPPERQIPAAVWAAVTRHYSNETNRPDQPCDCGNCPKENR